MKIVGIILLMMGLVSCIKENPKPIQEKPIIVIPKVVDTTTQTIPTLVGQTWVITNIRIGGIGTPNKISDTLKFTSKTTYEYNGYSSKYSLFYDGMGFSLSLMGTPWGYLDGVIYPINLNSGKIEGLPFFDITYNSNESPTYYLWLNKI
jgi:hypothetical protein